MMTTNARLIINELEYDILSFKYKFQRDIDAKGRPCSVYYGGDIIVEIESSDDIKIFQQMVHKEMPPIKGAIIVLSGGDEMCIRRIEFEKAYIYSYDEKIQCGSCQLPITTIAISPLQLGIDRKIFLDRRWPDTTGHWTNQEKEEVKYAKVIAADEKQIVEIYWTYGENKVRLHNKSRHYTDMNLHVVTEGYNKGDTISVLIESTDYIPITDQSATLKITGQVDAKGEMVIKNVLKEYTLNLQ